MKHSDAPLAPTSSSGLWTGNNPLRAKNYHPKNHSVSAESYSHGIVVIVKEIASGGIQISVADPTAKQPSTTIQIDGRWGGSCSLSRGDANTSVLRVKLPTGQRAGATAQAVCVPAAALQSDDDGARGSDSPLPGLQPVRPHDNTTTDSSTAQL